MTEAEAKNKWCPMTRMVRHHTDNPTNRNACGEPTTFCLGSACMMWRWHQWGGTVTNGVSAGTAGHCGLAGRPE